MTTDRGRPVARLAVGGALLAVGFAGGWFAHGVLGEGSPPLPPPTPRSSAKQPAPDRSDETAPPGRRRPVLDPELARKVAERIKASSEPPPQIKRQWPAEAGRDAPDQWPARMQRIFDECAPEGMRLDSTHCEEFPCLGLVVADEWPRGFAVDLTDIFGDDCAPLQEDMPDTGHAMLLDFDVDCPDGATESLLVFATGDADPLEQAYPHEDWEDSFDVLYRLMMDLSRRAETLTGQWPCAD